MPQTRKIVIQITSALVALLSGSWNPAAAQSLTPIYAFSPYLKPGDGGGPQGALIRATDGRFYGTTSYGGSSSCNYSNLSGCGTIFSTALDGNITILHSFSFAEGIAPTGNLIQATDGNYYSTTSLGGSSTCNGGLGCGSIFKIDAAGTLTVLKLFQGSDGLGPTAGLIQANDGNFYGTTRSGGPSSSVCSGGSCGVIFKLTTSGTFSVVHEFTGSPDGATPEASLIQADDGFLYGTTTLGGNGDQFSCGTIYRLGLDGSYTVVYRFPSSGSTGCSPAAELFRASDGNLYGTTTLGGTYSYGAVFRFAPNSSTVQLLTSFTSSRPSGSFPEGGIVQGADGNFYGTTLSGGLNNCYGQSCGTVFRVTPGGLLTTYSLDPADGCSPVSRLLPAADGNFYGTVRSCGIIGSTIASGTLVRFTPSPSTTTITGVTPTSGSVGTAVTLSGNNFFNAQSVLFPGPYYTSAAVAVPFTIISDNQIATSVQVGTGPGLISVVTAQDAAISSTRFTPALPTISSLNPFSGSPGTQVTITGSDFLGTTSVRFDSNGPFAEFTVISDTTIQAVVPNGATLGRVQVVTPAGAALSPRRYFPFGR